MRRFLCLTVAALLLCCLAVPAFAVGSGTTFLYCPLAFDYLCTGTNYNTRYGWIGNEIALNSSGNVSVGNYHLSSTSSSSASVSYDVTCGSTFALVSEDQVVDVSKLSSLKVGYGVDLEFGGTISYSFVVVDMRQYIDSWGYGFTTLNGSFTVTAGSYFNLGAELYKQISYVTSNRYVRIVDLRLVFTATVEAGTDYSPAFDFRFTGSTTNPRNSYGSWIGQYDLSHTKQIVVDPAHPTDGNFIAWLGDTASGFLSAPLFGEFSIGGMLAAVISIGLVVALIKFFS